MLLFTLSGCRNKDERAASESLATTAEACSTDAGVDAGSDAGHPADAAASGAPAIGVFGVYATESILMNAGSTIDDCNVGVEGISGPFLGGGVAAYLNSNSVIQPSETLYASTVYLNAGSSTGPIETTHLTTNGASTHGAVGSFPAMPAPPTMPTVTAGTTAVTLNTGSRTLAAGAYGAVIVNAGATLTLSGGTYVFASLQLNGNATLAVSAATTLSVTGNFVVNGGSYLGPATSSGLTAKSLLLYLDSSAPVTFNASSTVRALVVATNAEAIVNTGTFKGSLAAAEVLMNSGAVLTCEDNFAALGCSTSCDDGNPCTVDACSTGTCTHTPATNGTSCNDGNACDQNDSCQAGVCTAASHVTCTASDPCHTAGTCNPSTGQCSNPAAANGTTCNDGNACTQADSCQAGTCTGTDPVTCTASDPCHAAGTCNPSTGQCSNPAAANGTPCNDGNACDLSDTCQAGLCVAGAQVTCAASDQCHVAGACNPSTGQCSNPAAANGTSCNDGNACTQVDTCQAGACSGANPVTCTASDQCHAAGTCNPSTGQCSNPSAADGTSCSDGNACDLNDACKAGVCTAGSHVTCTASDQCHTAGTCNPSTGQCSNPNAIDGTACNDGNACTQTDTCASGTCSGSNPVACTAADQCHTAGTCNPSTGQCSNPTAPDGTTCNDGNACTQTDQCTAGACNGSNSVTCAASDQCHVAGSCNPSNGQCSNPTAADGTTCSDGNACTQTDTCTAGTCTGANPVTCAASDQCHTVGTCAPATGQCSNPPIANGTTCNDGNPCTQNDTCESGSCGGVALADGTVCAGGNKCIQDYVCKSGQCAGSNPVTCTASDACHVAGTCDPTSGACSNPAAADGTTCNDGNACTQTDACQAGACTGANPVVCGASDSCHVAGTCAPSTGACSNPAAADGTSCGSNDGGALVCKAGGCISGSTTCSAPQSLCGELCVSLQTDNANCGACGNACEAGYTCAGGACYSPAIMASCVPANAMSILVQGDSVVTYLPLSNWGLYPEPDPTHTGVDRIVIEGGAQSVVTIPTPLSVNSCASSWVTGETVCTANGTDVYLINGTTLTQTLTSGATGNHIHNSGGNCANCAVSIDSATNQAFITIGVNGSEAFQILDLSTNTFSAPILSSDSEDVTIDPVRQLALSPHEIESPASDFQIIKLGETPQLYDNFFTAKYPATGVLPGFDSSAEDCSTGVALSIDEDHSGQLTLVDLTQATFTSGNGNGTWSAPFSYPLLANLPHIGTDYPEMAGVAVAPGSSHLGIASEEFMYNTIAVFRLPSTSGSGTPALADWAGFLLPNTPNGYTWNSGLDPHTLTAYTSPLTGRAMGVVANEEDTSGPTSWLALVDLDGILNAPRTPGTNNLDPTYDLVGNGLVTFIAGDTCRLNTHGNDPNNCGACGTACPSETNATPVCNSGTCGLECVSPYGNCNSVTTDGCETDLYSDPANCGACGASCAVYRGTRACLAGVCGPLVCAAGSADCDDNPNNGCETTGSCPVPVVAIVNAATSVAVGASVTYTATARENSSRPLSYSWSSPSGPASVTFGSPTALVTTAAFPAVGSYVLQFSATDGEQTSTASVTVQASFINQPPVVTVGAAQSLTYPTLATTLTGSATDDGLPKGASLSATWTQVSGTSAAFIATPTASGTEPGPDAFATGVTFAFPGTYVFELDVNDTSLDGSAQTSVTIAPPTATTGAAPIVALTSPLDGALVTQPTAVVGSVSDGAWVLEYRLGGRDDVTTAYSVLASGSGPVANGTLGSFDPTLLLNGIYTLRLSAANSIGASSTSISVSVDGRMKVGNFTLAFDDLDVAVAGVPFELVRTYDSRDKSVGDFGVGWNLTIRDVRVEKSGMIGAYWTLNDNSTGFLDQYCLVPTASANVSITFPNGREYRFTPAPLCALLQPPDPATLTWQCTSDPNSPTIQLVAAGASNTYAPEGTQILNLSDNSIWDPRQFTLTVEDGSVYDIDQDLGVTQRVDRNKNTLTITSTGIASSLGPQVAFHRDAKNRITSIIDPNGASLTYAFSAAGDLTTFTDRAGNISTFTYAGNHYLQTYNDPLGRRPIRNDYDSSGRLLDQIDAAGNKVVYSPNLPANLEAVTDRLGRVTQYQYNQNGDVTLKVDPTGAQWAKTYDSFGDVLTSTDPLGHTTTSTYDGSHNLLTSKDPLGRTTTYTYNSYGEVLTATDPMGRVTTNTYDALGNLTETLYPAAPLANSVQTTYDSNGSKVSDVDALGDLTTYAYDVASHLLGKRTDALGHYTTYTYDSNGNKTSQAATRSNAAGTSTNDITKYAYDANGKLLKTTEPNSATRSITYTATGKQATTTDEIGRVTSYTYDTLDRLVTTTYYDGTTSTQAYDAENERTSSTDAAGNTTSYAYDGVGRLIRTTFADGTSTSTVYDAAGRATQQIDARGNVQWSNYDAAGQLVSTTDPTGATTQYGYDTAGNQITVTDSLGHVTTTTYDAADRPIATTYADGTRALTRYDVTGRVIARDDVLSHTTVFAYDALGRLTQVTDPNGGVTLYAYNEWGDRLSQTDANNHKTTFGIDLYTGRQISRQLPDGSTESSTYDLAGQLTQHTDFMGRAITYGYDKLGRLTSRTYPDASVVGFTYTPDGRRATATDARGTTNYGYDDLRRLTQVTSPDGQVLNYGYDASGNQTSLTATLAGVSLTTSTVYDALNRPVTVTDPAGRSYAVGYDSVGLRSSLAFPNGVTTTYGYDANNRVTDIAAVLQATSAAPVTVDSFGYTLDAAGRRTQINEADGTTRQYGYDADDRLTSESVSGSLTYGKTFAYDAVGNRQSQVTTGAGAASVAYTYDSRDRVLTAGTELYSYDANGNEISDTTQASYGYDFDNRLVTATLSGDSQVAYAYDADGNRVRTDVVPPPPAGGGAVACTGNTASFARGDTATHGNWVGVYGADGNYINAETAAPPSYGAATFAGSTSYTWAATTSDARALQDPPPGTSWIASTYDASTTETVHVTTTDGNAHTVALYLLDWDIDGRAETITAQTPTGTVLDAARSFTDFSAGEYAVYTICGDVDFVLTRTAGANAVVSGVFFGTPSSTAPAATLTTKALVDSRGALSQVVAETDGTGALTAYYVRVQDQLLAVMRPGTTAGTWTTRFVHEDALGSVRTLTDEEGNVVDARGYEAFGTKNVEAGSDPLAYGFAGEPLDAQTRLAYHRARWMDSRVGRFASVDPFEGHSEVPTTLHRYLYGLSDPVNNTDPSGLFSPVQLLIGNAVHGAIYEDFLDEMSKRSGLAFANRAISTIVGQYVSQDANFYTKLAYGASFAARPDLAFRSSQGSGILNARSYGQEPFIFEIKPDGLEGVAAAEVNLYLFLLNEIDVRHDWEGGTEADYVPPPEIDVLVPTVGWIDVDVYVSNENPGVILYSVDNTDMIENASSGVAAIGVGTLVAVTATVAAAETVF